MSDFTLVVLAGGNSTRFGLGVKKQWLRLGDIPLWLHVTNTLQTAHDFAKIVVVAHPSEVSYVQNHTEHTVVKAGTERQDSLRNALNEVDTPYTLVTDAARGCASTTTVKRLIDAKEKGDVVVSYLPISDTTVYENQTIDRQNVKLIQTPQLSRTDILKKALQTDTLFTDESSAIVSIGGSRAFVLGEYSAHKLTHLEDLTKLPCFKKPSSHYFVGYGFDVHAFEEHKPMVLGGIVLEDVSYGFKAHSDGDVAIHALIDALLGAASMDDIGTLFPDNDTQYANIDSKELLRTVVSRIKSVGFEIGHVDITIMAQQPKIAPHKKAIRQALAPLLQVALHHVNIKATTTEELGFVGRKEGVAVSAVATLHYFDWTQHI